MRQMIDGITKYHRNLHNQIKLIQTVILALTYYVEKTKYHINFT